MKSGWFIRVAVLTLTATALCVFAASAQPLVNGQPRPVAEGTVQRLVPIKRVELSPGQLSQPIGGTQSARSIRINISNISSNVGADDYVIELTTANGGIVRRYSKKEFTQNAELWTVPVPGSLVRFRLEITGLTRNAKVEFTVQQLAYREELNQRYLSVLNSPPQFEAIGAIASSPAIAVPARAVAKLEFISDGRSRACTAFMISEDRMLTNRHCVNNSSACATAIATFGYNDQGPIGQPDPNIAFFYCAEVLDTNPALDFALIRLTERAGEHWGYLHLESRMVVAGEPLMIIQHPDGDPKQVVRINCAVVTPLAPGVAPGSEIADLGHSCDTSEGSSGSPVFDANMRVVALHHLGADADGRWVRENRAVLMSLIQAHLARPP